MSEESRSIWTRPWRGRRKLYLWFGLLDVAVFVVVFCVGFVLQSAAEAAELALFAEAISVGVGLAAVLVVRFVRWLCCWRNFRRFLFGLVCLLTLVALFYAEENWRGARVWNKYRRKLEARGEQLDYRAFIPKPVPDDQNFAATPFLKAWFPKGPLGGIDKQWGDHFVEINERVFSRADKDRSSRKFVDLVAWQMALDAIRSGQLKRGQEFESDKLDLESRAQAAPMVLEGFKTDETILAELRAAIQRPYSRYPVVYDLDNPWGILIPHLAQIKSTCQRLRLRACAELAAGQSKNALEDVKLSLHLADSIKDEPFLISYLVRLACFEIETQPIWEGLAERRWSDAQLNEIQSRLQRYNFFEDMKLPLDGERAAGVLTADLLYRRKYRPSDLFDLVDRDNSFGGDLAIQLSAVAPRGWYNLEQLNYCRLYELQLEGALDAAGKRVFVDQVSLHAHDLEREVSGGRLGKGLNAVLHHQVIAALFLPELNKVPLKAAMAQTAAGQAALACVLERYRLANGSFPEKLDALVPGFISQLPNDVITGEPLKYRRTDDGQFVLYSVGWNTKDDGGTSGRTLFDEKDGDWVWRSSPAAGR